VQVQRVLKRAGAAIFGGVGSQLAEVNLQERLEAESKTRRLHAIETLEQVARLRAQLGAAVKTLGDANARLERLRFCKAEAERRIEVARELARRARALRTAKIREVFNDELNSVWRDLFIRLAPDERFVPAFALPETTTGQVEAILETHYRSGGKGGNPRAMLSTGNLNTAALTLFLALHLSVRPVLPWLVLDDPVQSMDDVHIAQLAALLRTLKQTRRQVIIAMHDRQLFEYLGLELSPAFNGDRLITIELGRGADGKTTAPWDLKTFEPDRAIAA
jgi:DNA repair protein SbcC/Rad50